MRISDDQIYKILSLRPDRIVLPHNWIHNIPFAFLLTYLHKPKVIVELGTHSGNSICAFAQSIKKFNLNAKLFAIDTWEGDSHSGKYSFDVYNNLLSYCSMNYNDFLFLKRMRFDDAICEFEDNSIDLLHIDGLHTYEAVNHDFETWKRKLSTESIVLFHDILVKNNDFGVYKFWSEIKESFPTYELNFGNGLGILFYGSKYKNDNSLLSDISYYNSNETIKLFGMNLYLENQLSLMTFLELKSRSKLNSFQNKFIYKIYVFFLSLIKRQSKV